MGGFSPRLHHPRFENAALQSSEPVVVVVASIVGVVAGIMFSRVIAEFVLIAFRINEHLGAIRDQGEMR